MKSILKKSVLLKTLLIFGILMNFAIANFTLAQKPVGWSGSDGEWVTPTPPPAPTAAPAWTPLPRAPSSGVGVTPASASSSFDLSEYLLTILADLADFKKHLIETINPLIGYFQYIAYLLVFLIALVAFYKKIPVGFDLMDSLKYLLTVAVACFAIALCGDWDGDGQKGDLNSNMWSVGNSLAFGTNGDSIGKYINDNIEGQSKAFNEAFDKFTENKVMVRVNSVDIPIKYPGDDPEVLLSALQNPKNSLAKEDLASQVWRMQFYFQALNYGRAAILGVDLFLKVIGVFLVIGISFILPIMFAFGVDEDYRKKITYPFLWSLMVLYFVYPFVAQITRYLMFTVASFGVGIGNTNHFFTYDKTNNVFTANGNPEPFMAIACFFMFISLLIYLFSMTISWKMMQGAFIETVAGIASSAMSTVASIGVGVGTAVWSGRIAMQSGTEQADGAMLARMSELGFTKEASRISAVMSKRVSDRLAKGQYDSSDVLANSDAEASNVNNDGSLAFARDSADNEAQATKLNAWNSAVNKIQGYRIEQTAKAQQGNLDEAIGNTNAGSKHTTDGLDTDISIAELPGENADAKASGAGVLGSVWSTMTGGGKGYTQRTKNAYGSVTDGNGNNKTPDMLQEGYDVVKKSGVDIGEAEKTFGKENMPDFYAALGGDEKARQRLLGGGESSTSNYSQTKVPFYNSGRSSGNRQSVSNSGRQTTRRGKDYGSFSGGNIGNLDSSQTRALANAVIAREDGSGNLGLQNQFGYTGLYQFGAGALASTGFIDNAKLNAAERMHGGIKSGSNSAAHKAFLADSSNWLIPGGLNAYKSSKQLQDISFARLANQNLRSGRSVLGSDQSKQAGFVMASHLKGSGAAQKWVTKGIDSKDGNGTKVSSYFSSGMSAVRSSPNISPSSKYVDSVRGQNIGDIAGKTGDALKVSNIPTSKVLVKQAKADIEYTTSLQTNRMKNEGGQVIEANRVQGQSQNEIDTLNRTEQIANSQRDAKMQASERQRGLQQQATNITLDGKLDSADILYKSSKEQSQIQYDSSIKVADINYRGGADVAEMQHATSLKALQSQNMSSLISSIGGTVQHQLSELFEKAGRF